MDLRGARLLAAVAAAMLVVFAFGILAATNAIDLPGDWKARLGLEERVPDIPCRVGLYRKDPPSPRPLPGRWQSEPAIPRTVVEGSAAAVGQTVYTFGGSAPGNLRTVLAFDTRNRRWTQPTALPTGLNHVQAVAHEGDVYLAGGYLEGEAATSNFWRYDPQANEWARLTPMGLPRGAAGAAAIGDRLYVAAGAPQTFGIDDPPAPFRRLEVYDFGAGTWTTGPDAPFAVHHVNAAALAGKLYLAGGRVDEEASARGFARYDPATERWEELPPLPLGPTSSSGLVAAAGKIVVIGGDEERGWEEGGGWVTPTAWAFDPAANRWQRLPDLAVERHALGAAVVGNRIYAIAGGPCPGLKPTGPVGTHTVESLPLSALGESPRRGP
ncbi:MAG TPA: kelch repeat-containing protein [Solirubrobacterales bacterium]|nr:kelch repeat-containing protein [Solirubrobacterales bacterium]